MKTDYTLTPEYRIALTERSFRKYQENQRWVSEQMAAAREAALDESLGKWKQAYEEARKSHAAGEPLIRTVCKIAARILFVLLLVGICLAVML